MGQTKFQSFLEAMANIVVGFVINIGAQIILLPYFGCEISMRRNFEMGLCFTVISLVRQYVLRRGFNRLMVRAGIRKEKA